MVCYQSSLKVRKYFAKMGWNWGELFCGNRDGYFWGMFWKYGADVAEGFPKDVPKWGEVVSRLMTLLKT